MDSAFSIVSFDPPTDGDIVYIAGLRPTPTGMPVHG
jgi:hypothetical protein